jgi:hypothetical protein
MTIFSVDENALDYEERLVAFIDVFGFADLVTASAAGAAAQDKVNKLIAIYKVFDWFVPQMLDRLVDGSFFSDTFILSARSSQALYLMRETGNLCRYLLLQGLPCRGAIATGLFHHRERIIIGPALVEAYRTEKSVAIHPRIVLDDAAADYWMEECAPTSAHHHPKSLVKKDRDGQNYLDIFDPQWAVFLAWTEFISAGADLVPSNPSQFLSAAFKRIQDGLKASGNTNVRAKYTWLADQCQMHAAALGMKL